MMIANKVKKILNFKYLKFSFFFLQTNKTDMIYDSRGIGVRK